MANHHSQPRQRPVARGEIDNFAHRHHTGPRSALTTGDGEGTSRIGATHAVIGKTGITLKICQCAHGVGAENAVDTTAVKAQPGEQALQLHDIITAHIRRGVVQQSVAETPARLNKRCPCRDIADAINAQAPLGLKLRHRCGSTVVITTGGTMPNGMAQQRQTALKITDRLTRGARPQGEKVQLAEPVDRSNSSSRADFDFAPMMRCTTSPLENTNSVGMLITW